MPLPLPLALAAQLFIGLIMVHHGLVSAPRLGALLPWISNHASIMVKGSFNSLGVHIASYTADATTTGWSAISGNTAFDTGVGGAGGSGGFPAGGGGGGGGTLNTFNSGAGGAGGAGLVRVYSW